MKKAVTLLTGGTFIILAFSYIFFACTQKVEAPNRENNISTNNSLTKEITDNSLTEEIDEAGKCNTAIFTYSGAIKPIMKTSCTSASCHDAKKPAAGINLTTYTGVKKVSLNGKLLGTITWKAGYPKMPLGAPKLTTCQITQIKKWINAGAPNN